jgi:pSer/pThr/pTyr-binding forkhead associated (FHA) protein
VEFEIDPDLGKGRFGCEASFVEGEEELAPQPAVGERGSLVRLTDGVSTALAKPSVTIGRLPECDVVVDDAGVSRQHARIRRTEGGFVLTDLGSTNGTMVNGEPIQEHVLEHGDRITIGETELEFRSG